MDGTLYCQFSFERLRPSWRGLPRSEQDACLNGLQYLLTRYPLVRVDHYRPRESDPECDFVLRWESDNPEALRNLVVEMRAADFYRHVETALTVAGATRAPRYASAAQLRDLARSQPAPTLKGWAFLFLVSRTSDWWHFPEADRQAMVQEHVATGLAYSPWLHRRCYYGQGLDGQQDFIYYVEANSPDVVDEAYGTLKGLRDGHYWARHGMAMAAIPITLGQWQHLIQAGAPPEAWRRDTAHPDTRP